MDAKTKCYWKVRTDKPYLSLSLKKIKLSDRRIPLWVETIERYVKQVVHNQPKNSKFIFVNKNILDGEVDLGWTPYSQANVEYHKRNEFKYMGEVRIPDYEVDADKYNL